MKLFEIIITDRYNNEIKTGDFVKAHNEDLAIDYYIANEYNWNNIAKKNFGRLDVIEVIKIWEVKPNQIINNRVETFLNNYRQ